MNVKICFLLSLLQKKFLVNILNVLLLKLYLPSRSEIVKPVQLAQVLNYSPLPGYCFTKPELIFMLEQGEDPWLLEKEFLSRSSPGKLLNTGRRHPRKLDLIGLMCKVGN